MTEPLKSVFGPELIAEMARHIERVEPGFDAPGFVAAASAGLEALELKARAAQIARALDLHLPLDFGAASGALVAALHPEAEAPAAATATQAGGIRGWAVMPMAEVVSARALAEPHHYDAAMAALSEMTRRFSAEFAVRPLILADPPRALGWLARWAADPNAHVRRLASEGGRPRLPWGLRLAPFVTDPTPLLPILTALRDDPSDYVRRSVANSLNDIAKDHPDRVAALARDWLADAPPARERLVRHACRGLVKAAHGPTLAALGFGTAAVVLEEIALTPPEVLFGDGLVIAVRLRSEAAVAQAVALDYVLHHRKVRGGTSPKVFKWRVLSLAAGAVATLTRRHPIRPITTRVYHDGRHRVEIIANGQVLGGADFVLSGTGAAGAGAQRVGTGISPR